MIKAPLMPGEVGKVFLDFKDDVEGFQGGLHAHIIFEDLKDVASAEEIRRLIERAEELEIIRNLGSGLLVWGPRMHLLQEYKESGGLMPDEHLSNIREYTFDLNRRSVRREQEFISRCLNFRNQRLSLIEGGDTFNVLPFGPPPFVVLQLVPRSPLKRDDERAYTYLSSLHSHSPLVRPMGPPDSLIEDVRVGDDYQTYAYNPDEPSAYSYLHVFRNGTIEAVRASVFRIDPPRLHFGFEREVVEALERFLSLQQKIGVEAPVGVVLTLARARGCHIVNDSGLAVGGSGRAILAGSVFNPATVIESFDATDNESTIARVMKQSFDRIWLEAGYVIGSPNYDGHGNPKWIARSA